MFGAAVARPRYNHHTRQWWDGKIHIHPFIKYAVAQRNSRNRPAGTIITKCISVKRDVYRDWICNHVVHAIVAQWPDGWPRDIDIQQDNAKPHIKAWDPFFKAVTDFYRRPENGGWNIKLIFQPPNSPDLNILDLALFRVMQSIQQHHQAKNVDELIAIVKKVWDEFPLATSIKVWTSLQLVMDEILKVNGGNNYKLPHMGKDKWARANNGRRIPLRMRCTAIAPEAEAGQPLSPQAAAEGGVEAQADDRASPTTVVADLATTDEAEALAAGLTDLSLQAVAEMDVDWEDVTEDLEWDGDEGHGEEDMDVDSEDEEEEEEDAMDE
jgi:hypothetical protein